MDIIIDPINELIDDAKNDEEFRQWFQEVDAYTHKLLLEPGYVLEPRCNSDGRRIRESGRRFYSDKYKAHFDRLFDSIGTWFSAMGEDPLNKRFGDDWARLTRDLLFDSEGSLKFKPELWMDIRKVILPSIVDRVRMFPFGAKLPNLLRRSDTSLFLELSTQTSHWISSSRTLPFRVAICSRTSCRLRCKTS
jgi:hypothetical protein